MNPDRTIAPPIRKPAETVFPQVKETELNNGLMCYCLEGGTQDVSRIDIVFKAGSRYEHKPLQAIVTSAMLREATRQRSGYELNEQFDFYGARFHTEVSKDRATVSLVALNKHLEKLLPLFAEACTQPAFQEKDLKIVTANAKQALTVNLQKVQFVCRVQFSEQVFSNTPYAESVFPEAYDELETADLVEFFNACYGLADAYVLISGKDTFKTAELFQRSFGHFNLRQAGQYKPQHFYLHAQRKEVFVERPEAVQSAIRIGAFGVQRAHPDFFAFSILTTALGGYFGSRLMKNIREDKGYTYGISAHLMDMEAAAVFAIITEVGAQHTASALQEIYSEIQRLKTEPLKAAEMDLVKNYLLGSIQKRLDGPFALADRLRSLLNRNLPVTFYSDYYKAIDTCTPEDLLAVAQKYFVDDKWLQVVVGPRF